MTFKPLLGDDYLLLLYESNRRPFWPMVKGYGSRLISLGSTHQYDAVICDQELLPYFPVWLETTIARRARCFIVDYDDAAYVKYQDSLLFHDRIPSIMRAATAVVVGNSNLARYAHQYSRSVFAIPTVVNLRNYTVKIHSAQSSVRVVWIGTPITAQFLTALLPTMRRLKQQFPSLEFNFIGAGREWEDKELGIRCPEWSEQSESRLISECDIGIMPLQDGEFERGKCGLKIIQYMAAGLPVVVSPVGANCDIVQDQQTGFLASDEEEWVSRLSLLIQDADLRRRFGMAARVRTEAHFSLECGFSKWSEVLASTLPSG